MNNYDAILFVSFGGPEQMDDVMPFLRNVVRGRGVPDERLLEVAENYKLFGGKSPINEQNVALINAVRESLKQVGVELPIYFGNRNWHPFLTDTMREMKADNIKSAICFVTSAYSSYSGCRQYREDIARCKAEAEFEDLETGKIRVFYNHPNFIEVNAENLKNALQQIPLERCGDAQVAFTAHSIPLTMAGGCDYEAQLRETCRLVAEAADHKYYKLVFQSRSGSPRVPWLEPDVNDYLKQLHATGARDVVVQPIGFISDHVEVLYDLDTGAKQTAEELGLGFVRAGTAGTHPKFVEMVRELILERITDTPVRRTVGTRPAKEDVCPTNCCLLGMEHGRK